MALTKVTGDFIKAGSITQGHLHSSHGITSSHIAEGDKLFFTNARARGAISVSGNALSYNSSTGVITSNFEESPAFTGNVDVAGNITVGGNDSIFAENNIRFKSSGAAFIDHNTTSQSIKFRLSNSSALDTTTLELTSTYSVFEGNVIANSGNITIGGKTYPKLLLNDNQGVARNFSVGTNNETFTVRNETAGSDALTISNANNATFAGDLTVTGGDITLGGTGRIQGIDTVSANTDAANKLYVDNQVAGIVDSAPGTLDTLNELAAALGDDANFSTTVTNSIALKAPLASPSFTGNATFAGGISVSSPGSSFYTTFKSANDYVIGLYDSANTAQWWLKAYTNGSFALHEDSVGDKFTIAAGGNATFAGDVQIDKSLSIGKAGGASGIGNLTLFSRYSVAAPYISFKTDHPSQSTVWETGKIESTDSGNFNGKMIFKVATGNGSASGGATMGTVLTLDDDSSATFAGSVTSGTYFSAETANSAYIRFKHGSGDLNYVGSSESLVGAFGDENDMLNYSASGKWGVYTNSTLALTLDESQNATFAGNVTGANLNISNWDTAYGWGNHASGGYAADNAVMKLTGNQTITGTKTFDNGSIVISGTHASISFMDTTSGQDNFYLHANSNNFYILVDRDGTDSVDGGYETPHPLQLEGDTNTAYVFGSALNIGNWNTAYGWGNHASAGYLTNSNDRFYLTDTRSASRAPSYYDDRYIQGDFSQSSNFGVSGGDSWAGILTVSKWASWDPGHRQEQLIFAGTKLSRRVATSDSAWSSTYDIIDTSGIDNVKSGYIQSNTSLRAPIFYDSNNTSYYADPHSTSNFAALNVGGSAVWTSGNDGSGSGLDADLLDGKDHTNFGATLATYGTTASSSGRIRCTAPFNTNSGKMFQVMVSLYGSYTQHTYIISAYMYSTTNQWYATQVIYLGTGSPDIIVGRDSNGKAYISIANGNYMGVRVHNMTRGYATSLADTYNPWTITVDAGTENSVSPTVNKAWTSGNDGSGSGLDADLLDGQQASAFQPAGSYAPAGGSYGTDWYANALYHDEWVRNHTNNNGHYWSQTGWHLYPKDHDDFFIRSGSGSCALGLTVGNETIRGYVYANTSNEIGFLNSSRNWSLKVDNSGNTYATSSHRAPIFYDSDDTNYYLNPAGNSILGGRLNSLIQIVDSRSSDVTPQDESDHSMRLRFTNQIPGNGNWQSLIQMKGWGDGYASWQIIGPSTTTVYEHWYLRAGIGTTWNTPRRIITSLGGDINHGQLKVHTSSSSAGSQLMVYSTTHHQYPQIHSNANLEAMWNYKNTSSEWYVGLRTSNQLIGSTGFHFYNTTSGQTVGGWDVNGHSYSIGSSRAPIFYDQNNTGYYINPASTSFISYLSMNNHIEMRHTSPTIYMRDTNHNSAMIHVNSNIFYVLRGGNDTTSWSQVGGRWPLEINLTNNAALFGSTVQAITSFSAPIYYSSVNTAYYVRPATSSYVNSLQTNGNIQAGASGTGNVYVGGTSGNHFRFHTHGGATYFDMNSGTINWRQGSSTRYYFYPSTANMTINGTLTQYSDIRYKENIVEIPNAIDKVKSIRGVYYNRTDFNTEPTKIGVIAQEVEVLMPELILQAEDTDMKSVSYNELTAVLVQAIKEQQTIIDDLKSRLETLENQ